MGGSRLGPVVVAVVVVAGLAGGCGASGATAIQTVAASPDKTVAAKTAKFSSELRSETGLFAKGVRTEGAFDFAQRRGRMTIDASSFGVPGLTGDVDTVLDLTAGIVEYLHLPKLQSQLQGKQWLKLDLGQLTKEHAGADVGAAVQGQSGDPSTTLQQLRGVAAVTEVGTEQVRGHDATHYRATVDLDKAVREAPAAARAELQKLVDRLTVKTLPVDVWVDDQGRVVRQVQVIDTAALQSSTTIPAAARLGQLTTTTELYDFGAAVDATPPPPDQVADFNALLKQAEAQLEGAGSQPS
jgi:hypothetical protein